jgi:hypothetical protein
MRQRASRERYDILSGVLTSGDTVLFGRVNVLFDILLGLLLWRRPRLARLSLEQLGLSVCPMGCSLGANPLLGQELCSCRGSGRLARYGPRFFRLPQENVPMHVPWEALWKKGFYEDVTSNHMMNIIPRAYLTYTNEKSSSGTTKTNTMVANVSVTVIQNQCA